MGLDMDLDEAEVQRLRILHHAREQEIAIAFRCIPECAFRKGLELGAGDCFQSRLLKRYTLDLTVSDLAWDNMDRSDPEIRYEYCDAELVDQQFANQYFDLVFSSNMLPHTPNRQAVLLGIGKVLDDDGVVILVMPNPWWKILKLIFFYPLLLQSFPHKVWRKLFLTRHSSRSNISNSDPPPRRYQLNKGENASQYSKLRTLLFPTPVGIYPSNLAEVLGSRRKSWVDKLTNAGWEVLSVRKGPFIVGQLGKSWNSFFSWVGLSTEYIYIVKKVGKSCRYEAFFRNPH